MIVQLNPPLPVMTPKGAGVAHFLIDYSMESHLYWAVFLDANGECWTFENPKVRMATNPSIGRPAISPFHACANSDDFHANRDAGDVDARKVTGIR